MKTLKQVEAIDAICEEQFKDLVDLAESGLKDLFLLQNEIIKNG